MCFLFVSIFLSIIEWIGNVPFLHIAKTFCFVCYIIVKGENYSYCIVTFDPVTNAMGPFKSFLYIPIELFFDKLDFTEPYIPISIF